MSVMSCNECGRYVDTDFDVEGWWTEDAVDYEKWEGFLCASCRVHREKPDPEGPKSSGWIPSGVKDIIER